jgi:hypothetical protein
MDKEMLSLKGGARVGWLRATWPFAKLTVQKEKIELNVGLLGKYSFSQEQIIAIEKYTVLPKVSLGIQFFHTRPEYPKMIMFQCSDNLDSIINKIGEIGFLPSADPSKKPKKSGLPFKWESLIWVALLWFYIYFIFS